MSTIKHTFDEVLNNTNDLSNDERNRFEDILDKADLAGNPDSLINTSEWQSIRSSPDYQFFLEKIFGRTDIDSQKSFTNSIDALYRPQSFLVDRTEIIAPAKPTPSESEAFALPVNFSDLSTTELDAYLTQQTELLKNEDYLFEDRLAFGEDLANQLVQQGLSLEAAVVYEAMGFVAAVNEDLNLDRIYGFKASYARHFDTTKSLELSQLAALKKLWEQDLETITFFPSKILLQARIAIIDHKYAEARQSLESIGWWILDQIPQDTGYTNLFGPWNDSRRKMIPDFLLPYWSQSQILLSQLNTQEQREQTIELLMLENQEDHFNLADEMAHTGQISAFGASSGFFDKYVAYPFQSALASLNMEESSIQRYQQRIHFREKLAQAIVQGHASSLEDAVLFITQDANDATQAQYQEWKEWRQYRPDVFDTYDRDERESNITTRSDLDVYWQEKIATAQRSQNYDKVLFYLDTILEADLTNAETRITASDRDAIIADAEKRTGERMESIIAKLERENPEKEASVIEAMAQIAFHLEAASDAQERIKTKAMAILTQTGVAEAGPFSKDLRSEALGLYKQILADREKANANIQKQDMIIPLLLSGGLAFLARARTAAILGETLFMGTTPRLTALEISKLTATEISLLPAETYQYAALELVVGGGLVGGTVFNTTQAVMASPVQGSSAFDNYLKNCALSAGMFIALDIFKVGYTATARPFFQQNFATGRATGSNLSGHLELTPSADATYSLGELGGEAATLTAYGYFEDHVRGGHGTPDDLTFAERYGDALITIVTLKAAGGATQIGLSRLRRNLKPGETLHTGGLEKKLAGENAYVLSASDFRDLAIKLGSPEMAELEALTDRHTGTVFLNRSRLNSQAELLPQIDYLLEHEAVHGRFNAEEFSVILNHKGWQNLKQRYLDEIYPSSGTKPLTDVEILEEIIAHYRQWRSLEPTALGDQRTSFVQEIGDVLRATGLDTHHLVTNHLVQLPVRTEGQGSPQTARAAASWEPPTTGNTTARQLLVQCFLERFMPGELADFITPDNIVRPQLPPRTASPRAIAEAAANFLIDNNHVDEAFFAKLENRMTKHPQEFQTLKKAFQNNDASPATAMPLTATAPTTKPAQATSEKLSELLLDFFTGSEDHLRSFIKNKVTNGYQISFDLPGLGNTPAFFAKAVAKVLIDHGAIDQHFFNNLKKEYPRRVSDIEKFLQVWKNDPANTGASELTLESPQPAATANSQPLAYVELTTLLQTSFPTLSELRIFLQTDHPNLAEILPMPSVWRRFTSYLNGDALTPRDIDLVVRAVSTGQMTTLIQDLKSRQQP